MAGLSTVTRCSLLRSNNRENQEGKSALGLTAQECLVRGHPFTQQIPSEHLPWSPTEALGTGGHDVRAPYANTGQHGTEGQGARVPSCWQKGASLCGSEPTIAPPRAGHAPPLVTKLGGRASVLPLWLSASEE